mgnify:FL=1
MKGLTGHTDNGQLYLVGMRTNEANLEVIGKYQGTHPTPLKKIGDYLFEGGEWYCLIFKDYLGKIVHRWDSDHPDGINGDQWRDRNLSGSDYYKVRDFLLRLFLYHRDGQSRDDYSNSLERALNDSIDHFEGEFSEASVKKVHKGLDMDSTMDSSVYLQLEDKVDDLIEEYTFNA